MSAFAKWILATFTSPIGVALLAALDSTPFFSLPFGIDAAVIILSARSQSLAWSAPGLATLGSAAGAALTFWMGVKIGEKGLDHHVSRRMLKRVRRKIETSGAVALAALDLIPPPFPFTAFVLTAGALRVRVSVFFITLVICRMIRFGFEAWLAVRYGKPILAWLDSDIFHDIASACILLAILLSVLSVVRIVRSSRPPGRRAAV